MYPNIQHLVKQSDNYNMFKETPTQPGYYPDSSQGQSAQNQSTGNYGNYPPYSASQSSSDQQLGGISGDIRDRAIGCLFGSFLGDTMGSFLEFSKTDITEQVVDEALRLPGGGVHKVHPGQLTDDGELAICLSQALIGTQENDIFKIFSGISEKYHYWANSNPFDFGNTMQQSWSKFLFKTWEEVFQIAKGDVPQMVRANVLLNSMESQSNGFLMKQAPLGILLWNQPTDIIFEFAKLDTTLTHCHKDHFKIYAETRQLAYMDPQFSESRGLFPEIEKLFIGIEENDLKQQRKPNSYRLRAWPAPNNKSIGWVKIAFTFSMIALVSPNDNLIDGYFRPILKNGGDTDTNMCIAVAMLGARFGYRAFDRRYSEIIDRCNPEMNKEQPRSSYFSPKQYMSLANGLLKRSLNLKISLAQNNASFVLESVSTSNMISGELTTYKEKKDLNLSNQNLELLQNCDIKELNNCYIKSIVNCKIKSIKQSRIVEIIDSQIDVVDGCLFADSELSIQKKEVKIKQKKNCLFSFYNI